MVAGAQNVVFALQVTKALPESIRSPAEISGPRGAVFAKKKELIIVTSGFKLGPTLKALMAPPDS